MGLLNLVFNRIPRDHDLFSSKGESNKAALAFIHIPKTAGTWFTSFLMQHFGQDEIAPPPDGPEAPDWSDPSKRLFQGHFRFVAVDSKRPLRLVTFLRDPFERTASHYRSWHTVEFFSAHWRARASAEVVEAVEWVQRASYEEFVRSDNPIVQSCICDVQTSHLTSCPDQSHPDYLKSAIRNLEKTFLFVGLQEFSAESIRLFRYQTGSMLEPIHPVRNVSKVYDVTLSAAAKDRLRELVQNDVVLHQAGRRLFDRRLAAISGRSKAVA